VLYGAEHICFVEVCNFYDFSTQKKSGWAALREDWL